MKNPGLIVAAAVGLAAGCAGAVRMAPGGKPLTFPAQQAEVGGTLIEARCYFNTGAIGGDHTYCAFMSAKANLPLGVYTDRGEFVFLTSTPSRLAAHMTRRVIVRGVLTPNRQLLRPDAIRVRSGSTWHDVEL